MKHTKKRGYVFVDKNDKRIVTDWRGRRRRNTVIKKLPFML